MASVIPPIVSSVLSYSVLGVLVTSGVELLAGGVTSGVTVASGGVLDLVQEPLTHVSGSAGGVLGSATKILGGGAEIVNANATEISGTVESGGLLLISGGSAVSETVASGGNLTILGGTVTVANIAAGASVFIGSGGAGVDLTLAGEAILASGGRLDSGTVGSGGLLTISSGGSTHAETVQLGGIVAVQNGGTASDINLTSGGVLDILSGGLVSGLTASSGAVISLGAGAQILGATIGSGVTILGGSGYIISGGMLEALVAGPGPLTLIGSGGTEVVSAGAAAVGVTIGSGATLSLGAGAGGSELVISGGTLTLNSGAMVGDAITFAGSGGTLVLDNGTSATLLGFGAAPHETVILSGLPFSSGATVSSIGSELLITDGGMSATLTLSGLSTAANVTLGDAGGVLEVQTACYAAGTRILTQTGEVAVEALQVGDTVVTVRAGGPPTAKIVWTGRRAIDIARQPDPSIVYPVRILAGAFGGGLPERDLLVSPHHGIVFQGELFEAIALVNGETIIQDRTINFITYHHIELEAHDIVLAEGLPAESFINTGNRGMFENSTGVVQLFPDWRTADNAPTCVTLHRSGAAVARAHAALARLAAQFRTAGDGMAARHTARL
jgi:antigen 43